MKNRWGIGTNGSDWSEKQKLYCDWSEKQRLDFDWSKNQQWDCDWSDMQRLGSDLSKKGLVIWKNLFQDMKKNE